MVDLVMDDEKLAAMEQAGMLKNRYYIVLEPHSDEDEDSDGFSIRAYATKDTHTEVDGEKVVCPTYVILQGLLGAIHEEFDYVYDVGLERVTLETLSEVLPEEELDKEHKARIESMEGNVIRANFGPVQ